MSQKLLKLSTENISEVTNVSIRTLRSSTTVNATSGAISLDVSDTEYIRVNLLEDTTLTLTGATKDGQNVVLAIVQADTVVRSCAFDTVNNIRTSYDIPDVPLLTQELGKTDRLIFIYDSVNTKYDLVGYSRGY